MANALIAEIAEPSFAAMVAAMQQLTLALNANLAVMSNSSAMAALNGSLAPSATAITPAPQTPAPSPTPATPPPPQIPSPAPALATASSPSVPECPSPDGPASDGIHPDDVAQLPEVVDGPPTDSWYAVIVGVAPGVYHDWEEVGPLVNGISGVVYRKHPSKAQALEAYAKAWQRGQVRRSR